MEIVEKLIVLRPPLVKMLFIIIFWCLCEYAVHIFLYTNEAVNKLIEIQIHFCLQHLNLKRKRNSFLYHLAHVWKSFIVHQVIYSFFPLVWQHSSFQLSNSLIQTITAFVGVIMITDAFIHNNDTLQWIGYSYALKSALFPHPNTQSPDVTECKRSLR